MADGDTIQDTGEPDSGDAPSVPWRIEPRGTTVLIVDDPADVSLTVADALGADLVLPGEDLAAMLDDRAERQAQRRAAEEALAVYDRINERPPADLHVIADTDELRRLLAKLRRAGSMIEDTTHEVARRYGEAQGQDLAVHPETIRRGAAELLEARGAVEALEAELEALLARSAAADDHHRDPWGDDAPDLSGADAFGATGDADAARILGREGGRFRRRRTRAAGTTDAPDVGPDGPDPDDALDRRVLFEAVLVVVVSTLIAVAVTATGIIAYGLGFVLPILAVVYAIGLVREQRVDKRDRSMAADNLAAVQAITDQAYGGSLESLRPPEEPASLPDDARVDDPAPVVDDPAVASLRARLKAASSRRDRAQESWESLVGPDADPTDLDSVLRTRDAQYALSDEQLQSLPSVRAVSRFERRLQARWKVAWAALDREPPALDDADEAIDALEAADVFAVTVERHQDEPVDEARQRLLADFDERSDGATPTELRTRARARLRPIVVADEEGDFDPARIDERRAEVGDDLQVIVVRRA